MSATPTIWAGGMVPRWPVGPLLAALRERSLTVSDMPDYLDRAYYRGKINGLSDQNADRAATWLGVNPVSIWPDWNEPVSGCLELEASA